MLTEVLHNQECEKGWKCINGIPDAVQHYYRDVKNIFRKKYLKYIFDNSGTVESILKYIVGSITAKDCINTIIRKYSDLKGTPVLTEVASKKLLGQAAASLFHSSKNVRKPGKGDSLMNFFSSTIVFIQSKLNEQTYSNAGNAYYGYKVFRCLPITHCFITIVDANFALEQKGLETVLQSKDWDICLRSTSLPADDKVFSIRAEERVAVLSSSITRSLRSNLTSLIQYTPLSSDVYCADETYVDDS
jgi:hypothetical protein